LTVELPILGLLKDRPMHGYELRQALEKVVGHFWSVSWGSLYPMLKKLEERDHLSSITETQEKGPDRIVYQITSAGEKRLVELLTTSDPSPELAGRNDFHVKVAFFHLLSRSQRLQILDTHKSRLQEKLDALLAEKKRVGQRTNHYRKALLDYAVARLQTDLAWVTSLIQADSELLFPLSAAP